eukprot:TRINITY_DN52945_c0_g1_i1.p1 TRINITY_DN52945_c0_g1~~TRINITY_DN52945_c0_g1_i1.p1  ORF type:complete len:468 (-),score=66.51 TRINITY_DN52945_c0_g1_i1:141-1544(-)
MTLTSSEELLAGCEDVAICHASGCGRILRAMRDVRKGEKVLSAPLEHQVSIPQLGHTFPSSDGLALDFWHTDRICKSIGSIHSADLYWCALMSLTADECKPAWPSVPHNLQERLLLLYRPHLASSCKGREPVVSSLEQPSEEAAQVGELSLGCQPMLSMDLVVKALCKHFSLQVKPSKLEDLVNVWKYNSFNSNLEAPNPLTERHILSEEPIKTHTLDLYLVGSLCNHSCAPNCFWECGEDGCFDLFAGADISSEEELTISYLDESALATHTLQRRCYLASNWLFLCRCTRCQSWSCMPTCPRISLGVKCSCTMHATINYLTEVPRDASSLTCEVCRQGVLQTQKGHFFECKKCSAYLCPECAAERGFVETLPGSDAAAALWHPGILQLSGRWVHRDFCCGSELILGDALQWAKGGSTLLQLLETSNETVQFTTKIDGSTFAAELVNGEIIWSDGDVWLRDTTTHEK